MDKQARMKKLVEVLNQASKAYYQEDRELFSNKEYDELYDELQALEAETGIVMSQSPTQNVGYEVLSELEKETHESPMLSLDKTKSPEALRDWLGEKEGLLSWKMDGLTVVLTYRDGVLQKAVTRGNGIVGEVITNNARVFKNLPQRFHLRVRLFCVVRRLLNIRILKRLTKASRTWMPAIRTLVIYAAVPSASLTTK